MWLYQNFWFDQDGFAIFAKAEIKGVRHPQKNKKNLVPA